MKHWSRRGAVAWLLWPASLLFRLMVSLRRTLYRLRVLRSVHPGSPVVVVGNLTAGGTGKTPLVLWIAELLRGKGWTPGIVSRGYGGNLGAPGEASIASEASVVGDEPIVLARRSGCPVWVGADRVRVIEALRAAHPRTDVLLLDDGLQHYRLPRAVEIVVVDGQRGFGNGALLPAGPLREPRARLATGDAIVVNGAAVDEAPAMASAVPTFAMRLSGERFVNLAPVQRAVGAEAFRGQRVHAIAGIGNPERFFAALRALGLDPICHAFPDHHAFTAQDLAWPDADAILMTDKDAIKCQVLADARMWTLPVETTVAPGLIERILEKMHGRQAA